jgi:hypothetical protein
MPFANPDTTFENEAFGGPISTVVPLTGTTIAMRYDQRDLYVTPAGTLAALTIKLPTTQPGGVVEILISTIVTALAIQDRFGVAVAGAPTAATAGMALTMRFVSRATGWVKWR